MTTMGASEKVPATFHPGTRPTFTCPRCNSTYPSALAALDCEDQCALEDTDRKTGRLFHAHRDTEPRTHKYELGYD